MAGISGVSPRYDGGILYARGVCGLCNGGFLVAINAGVNSSLQQSSGGLAQACVDKNACPNCVKKLHDTLGCKYRSVRGWWLERHCAQLGCGKTFRVGGVPLSGDHRVLHDVSCEGWRALRRLHGSAGTIGLGSGAHFAWACAEGVVVVCCCVWHTGYLRQSSSRAYNCNECVQRAAGTTTAAACEGGSEPVLQTPDAAQVCAQCEARCNG
jgi:hypothetical protein